MTTPTPSQAGRARYLPFAVFMAFIGIDEAARQLAAHGLLTLTPTTLYYLYPVKALVTAAMLFHYRSAYSEFSIKDLANVPATLLSLGSGVVVFFLWINMPWSLSSSTAPAGFNPTLLPEQVRLTMTAFRMAGAVLLVPLMEELFWRSFLIRYITDPDFEKVPVGQFTWPSFLITILLFGLEHNYVAAGITAGILYSVLLYRTRSIALCTLSHAVTNLLLAFYVLRTGNWHFW